MFISPAWAQGAAGGGGMELIGSFLPLILIFAIFYFLLIRPQQKKQKEHQAKLTAVRRGDRVLTGGGIYGTVTKVLDNELQVEIADGLKVKVATPTLMDVLSKTEPAKSGKSDKAEKDSKKSDDADDADDAKKDDN